MKKIIVILSLIFTIIVAGGLYGTVSQLDKEETVSLEQGYMNQFPDPMPDVALVPMTGHPLY